MSKYRSGDGCRSVIHITTDRNAVWARATRAFCQRNVHKARLIPLCVAAAVQIDARWCTHWRPRGLKRGGSPVSIRGVLTGLISRKDSRNLPWPDSKSSPRPMTRRAAEAGTCNAEEISPNRGKINALRRKMLHCEDPSQAWRLARIAFLREIVRFP